MKNILLLLIVLAPYAVTAQDYIVPAGTQKTLTPEDRTLSLKKFSLGDNVVIIIPPSMNGWTVTATDVSIGNNVKIIAMGSHGANGLSGSSAASSLDCLAGMHGTSGMNAAPGVAGKNISLTLKIRSIGSLFIQANGGSGGYGGSGGDGGRGGNASCYCNAGKGGNGGRGGNGGNGGAGGNVTINYTKAGNVSVSNSNFTVHNPGGAAGMGGAGGKAGQGGAGGGCTDSKSAARPAGTIGLNGTGGVAGAPGRNGTTILSGR